MSLLDTGPIELSVALHAITDRVLVSNVLSCQPPVKVDDTIEVIYGETVVYYIHLLRKYTLKPSVPGINQMTLLHFDSSCLKDYSCVWSDTQTNHPYTSHIL